MLAGQLMKVTLRKRSVEESEDPEATPSHQLAENTTAKDSNDSLENRDEGEVNSDNDQNCNNESKGTTECTIDQVIGRFSLYDNTVKLLFLSKFLKKAQKIFSFYHN